MATPGAIPLFRPPDPEEVAPYKPETALSIGIKGAATPNAAIFLTCLDELVGKETDPKDILMIPRKKLDSHDAGWQAYVNMLKAKNREDREKLVQDMYIYYSEQFSDEMVAAREQQKRERDAIFARQKEKEEVEFVKLTGVKWKDYQQWVEHDKQKDKMVSDKDHDIKALNKNINELQAIIDTAYRDKASLRGEIEKLRAELDKFKATDRLQAQLIQSHEKNANVVMPIQMAPLPMGPPMDTPARNMFVGGAPPRGHEPNTPHPDGSFYHPQVFPVGMSPMPTPAPAGWHPGPQAMGPSSKSEHPNPEAGAGPAGPCDDNDDALYDRPADGVRPIKRPASKSPIRIEKDGYRIPNVDASHTKHRRILVAEDKDSSGPAEPPEKRDRRTQRIDASNARAKRTEAERHPPAAEAKRTEAERRPAAAEAGRTEAERRPPAAEAKRTEAERRSSAARAKRTEAERRPPAAGSPINEPAAPATENRPIVPREKNSNRPDDRDNPRNDRVGKVVDAARRRPRVMFFTSAVDCDHQNIFRVICEGPLEYMKWDRQGNRIEAAYIHPRDAEKVYEFFNHGSKCRALRKHYDIEVSFAQPNKCRPLPEETVRDILSGGASRILCIFPVTRSMKGQILSEVRRVFDHDLRETNHSNGGLFLEFWDLDDAMRVKSQIRLPSHISVKYEKDNSCWRDRGGYGIKEVWDEVKEAADDTRRKERR